jgi:glycosyltransferase involved in cell wall biosynthesis
MKKPRCLATFRVIWRQRGEPKYATPDPQRIRACPPAEVKTAHENHGSFGRLQTLNVLRMPDVSIIVPNYNHARFLPRRMDSILRQTFQDFELILLDDGSTDNSRSILTQYAKDPRVKIEFNETNSGSTFKQWNKGVRLAHGKYVWIAESDDDADVHLLERLVAALAADPGIAFAYCRSRCVDEAGRPGDLADVHFGYDPQRWAADFCDDGHDALRGYFWLYNPIVNASAVVFRKDVYEQVGGADESLRYCGDWKLWAAMVLKGKLAYLCEPLNYYRFHAATVRSNSSDKALHIIEPLQVLRWMVKQGALSRTDVEKVYEAQAGAWIPVVMSPSTPSALKWTILRHVWGLDPHPVRRAARPALRTVWQRIRRHWRDLRSLVTAARN